MLRKYNSSGAPGGPRGKRLRQRLASRRSRHAAFARSAPPHPSPPSHGTPATASAARAAMVPAADTLVSDPTAGSRLAKATHSRSIGCGLHGALNTLCTSRSYSGTPHIAVITDICIPASFLHFARYVYMVAFTFKPSGRHHAACLMLQAVHHSALGQVFMQQRGGAAPGNSCHRAAAVVGTRALPARPP